jgi:hypothetical protein
MTGLSLKVFILLLFLVITIPLGVLVYCEFIDHTYITQEVNLEDIEHELYQIETVVWFSIKGDTSIYKIYIDKVKCDDITSTKEARMTKAIEDEKKLKVMMSNFEYCIY